MIDARETILYSTIYTKKFLRIAWLHGNISAGLMFKFLFERHFMERRVTNSNFSKTI